MASLQGSDPPSFGPASSNFDFGSFPQVLVDNDPELVHPDVKYICPIHNGLLRDPVQTKCGHRMCRACVAIYLDGQESKPCPVDDEDVEQVTIENIFPDPGFLREIKNLQVYCSYKNNGCKETIKLRDLSKHMSQCNFRTVACKYGYRGCKEQVVMCFQSQHEPVCGFQPASCRQCGQEYHSKDLEDHEKNQCPEGIIACPYKCDKKMKRREVEDHTNSCSMKPSECHYKILGCDFKGDKQDVEAHEKNFEIHFETLVTYVCNMQMELRNLDVSLHRKDLVRMREKIDSIEGSVKSMNKDFKVKIVSTLERLIKVERDVDELKKEQVLTKEELADMKKGIQELTQSIGQMGDPSRQLSKLEVRMAENDLRFQMIETANYDGNLLWKIRDFSIRRRDALQGQTVSLYSQPFYSSRFGYKMCARVYLNGDGIGKGTHVSLYFVVMKGEYDALLPWPFQLKISLVLLDQSPQKKHLKDEFLPDPASTSFQRPQRAEMNVASGCPLFVAHSVIDNPTNQYVKDDMLFIKVSVDCSQLPPI